MPDPKQLERSGTLYQFATIGALTERGGCVSEATGVMKIAVFGATTAWGRVVRETSSGWEVEGTYRNAAAVGDYVE